MRQAVAAGVSPRPEIATHPRYLRTIGANCLGFSSEGAPRETADPAFAFFIFALVRLRLNRVMTGLSADGCTVAVGIAGSVAILDLRAAPILSAGTVAERYAGQQRSVSRRSSPWRHRDLVGILFYASPSSLATIRAARHSRCGPSDWQFIRMLGRSLLAGVVGEPQLRRRRVQHRGFGGDCRRARHALFRVSDDGSPHPSREACRVLTEARVLLLHLCHLRDLCRTGSRCRVSEDETADYALRLRAGRWLAVAGKLHGSVSEQRAEDEP